MRIGVVKEIKPAEHRVALTPAGAVTLTTRGHTVLLEKGAGTGAGFADEDYRLAGAVLVSPDEVWGGADVVVKARNQRRRNIGICAQG